MKLLDSSPIEPLWMEIRKFHTFRAIYIHWTLWSMGYGYFVSHYSVELVSYQFQRAELPIESLSNVQHFSIKKNFYRFFFSFFHRFYLFIAISVFFLFRLSFDFLAKFNSLKGFSISIFCLFFCTLKFSTNPKTKISNETHTSFPFYPIHLILVYIYIFQYTFFLGIFGFHTERTRYSLDIPIAFTLNDSNPWNFKMVFSSEY